MKRLSGQNFDTMIGDLLIHVEEISATITDNRKAVMNGGVPNGYVDGDVSCSGEITVDSKNLNLIIEVVKSEGSFRGLPPFDIINMGKTINEELKFELFGCLLTISDLFNIDPKGGDKTTHKLPFEVTSPDFVRINGSPYLSEDDTRNL